MAKSNRKQNTPSTAHNKPQVLKALELFELPAFLQNTRANAWAIFGLAFLLYANTLWHGFVLDDAIVIKDNMYTQKGIEGIPGILSKDTFFGFFKVEGKDKLVTGGRYRPLTLVLFALVHPLAGDSPFVYHLLTVLLFAFTCMVLYQTLLLLFKEKLEATYGAALAFVAAVLFTVHPIHTEVVANIKGCDEIVVLLGSIGALWFTLKAWDSGKASLLAAAALSFFLGSMSKENAVAYVFLIPLALWFFRSGSLSKVLQYSAPAFAAFMAFFLIRGRILGWSFDNNSMELMNNPFLKVVGNQWVNFSASEKFASIFYTLGKYIQLLVFPHPLTHDYYPRVVPIMGFSNPFALLSLLAYLGMGWYVLSGWSQKDPIRFGILAYILPLGVVSNLLFPVGTNMGERFAFMPSVGFSIVAATLLLGLARQSGQMRTMLTVLAVVGALFSLKTFTRNFVWESNEKIFFTDLKTSSNSAKLQSACAGTRFDQGKLETDKDKQKVLMSEAVEYATKALQIYPNYKDALLSRGGAQFYLGNFDGAIADYRMAIAIAPGDARLPESLALSLREGGKQYGEMKGNPVKALEYLNESWKINPKDAQTAHLMGIAYGVQKKNVEALDWFKKAVEMAPKEAMMQFDLGTAYYLTGDAIKGAACYQKAAELDPKLKEKLQQQAAGQR